MRIQRSTQRLAVVFSSVFMISGCAGLSEIPFSKISNIAPASYTDIDDPIANGAPIALYGHVARNIKQCWLRPPEQLLKKHAFFAKATPDEGGGRATITLNELTKDGKKGLTAFKVEFLPLEGGKTNVRIDNFRFPEPMGEKLKLSVRYWSKGHQNCDPHSKGNEIVSIPPGAKIKPMPVSQKTTTAQ